MDGISFFFIMYIKSSKLHELNGSVLDNTTDAIL